MKACKGTLCALHDNVPHHNVSGGMKRRYNNVMAQGERDCDFRHGADYLASIWHAGGAHSPASWHGDEHY